MKYFYGLLVSLPVVIYDGFLAGYIKQQNQNS